MANETKVEIAGRPQVEPDLLKKYTMLPSYRLFVEINPMQIQKIEAVTSSQVPEASPGNQSANDPYHTRLEGTRLILFPLEVIQNVP